MRAVLLLLVGLTGCGYAETHAARDPLGRRTLIQMNVQDLTACAGFPDTGRVLQTSADEMQMQWSVTSNTPAFKMTVPLIASIQLGDAGSCKMLARVFRDGTVAGVNFPGATASLTGGPYSACGQIVSECLIQKDQVALPKGYDAFAYYLGKAATVPKP